VSARPDQDVANVFDEYADDYDATIQDALGASGESVAFFASLRADIAARLIGPATPQLPILDFGCGIGNMTRQVASRLPCASVVGTDRSEHSLTAARSLSGKMATEVQYVVTPADRLPFPDATFDFAFSSGVFHHILPGERLRWARELRRVLAPRGRFCLFEHNPLNPLTVRVVRRIPFDRDAHLIRARESIALLRQAGFAVASAQYYFFFPRALRALRALEPLLRRIPIGAQYFVVGQAR
jgi:ubiquinone/menaquinone biosynthesis C-methylase UbiE